MTCRPERLPSLSFRWLSRSCHSRCWLLLPNESGCYSQAVGFKCCLKICCSCPVWFCLSQRNVSFPSLLPGCLTPPSLHLCFCMVPFASAAALVLPSQGLEGTSRCVPCPEPLTLLEAVTNSGVWRLPEVGMGRAGTTAGAGLGASSCTNSLGAESATETGPEVELAVGRGATPFLWVFCWINICWQKSTDRASGGMGRICGFGWVRHWPSSSGKAATNYSPFHKEVCPWAGSVTERWVWPWSGSFLCFSSSSIRERQIEVHIKVFMGLSSFPLETCEK